MKVPFRLRRTRPARPAAALLLLSHDPAALLSLCARLAKTALPRVYRVVDGFLLLLARPTDAAFPATARLRALAENLLLPADAELVPALLDDEARGLVHDRGLVFLPNGRVLGFDPARPVELAALLDLGERGRRQWKPLPAGPAYAERIHSITLDLPTDQTGEILEGGGEGIGTETPRPDDAGVLGKMFGQLAYGAGSAAFQLGNLLGMKSLAGIGAQWIQAALSMMPRLSESLLGRQEAAVRELLRQFREGNTEEALRRALPLGGEGDRGGVPFPGFRLPFHNLRYSLAGLLGGGGGAAGIWFGGADVQQELAREYRRAAEKALERGDFRRAAYIYGKLLRDYRGAANALMRGGLYHDAAVVFLKMLGDWRGAAAAYEAGGEFDQALAEYRRHREHLRAGDLLRRLGDEEAAVAEYILGAEFLVEQGDYYRAAEIMLAPANRPELAQKYLKAGWQARPAGNAVRCAVFLATLHADRGEPQPVLDLTVEARTYFDPSGDEVGAEQFYNAVAKLADRPALAAVRDEIRDHALQGLAAKLRQRAAVESRPGPVVSKLLGNAGVWPAPAVRDAQFAYAAALKRPDKPTGPRFSTRVRLAVGQVTAVAAAPLTGEVFAGFLSGDVVCFRPAGGEVVRVKSGDGLGVTALAVAPHGQAVLVLQTGAQVQLGFYGRTFDGNYRWETSTSEQGQSESDAWLTPVLAGDEGWYGLGIDDSFWLRSSSSAKCVEPPMPVSPADVATALLFPSEQDREVPLTVLLFAAGFVWQNTSPRHQTTFSRQVLGWTPGLQENSSLRSVPLSWLRNGNQLEIAGVDAQGSVRWHLLQFGDQGITLKQTAFGGERGYFAATIVRPGLVAAVKANRINWLRASGSGLSLRYYTPVSLPNAVACFASAPTNELIVVCRDGVVERGPFPVGF